MGLSGKKGIFILIAALLLLSILCYQQTIALFPAYLHSWTQSDRYAISLGFLNNGFDFFHPQTFNQMTVDGITRVDFPINEYIIAIFMKLFGSTSPAIFRVYTLLVSLIGLVYLYLLTKKITSSEIKARLVPVFVFFAPSYAYYQDGFIPTVSAIAFVFIAYYHYFSYRESATKKQFYISILFFTLAALVRMPFVLFLMAVFFQQAYLFFKKREINKFEVLVFTLGFGIFISYFFYNLHLYRIYGTIFLDHLTHPKDFQELKEILKEMYRHWGLHYFTIWHYLLLIGTGLMAFLALIMRKSIEESDKKYWFQLFIISCGVSIYFLAMAKQYFDHDYYFLDSFFVPIVLFFALSLKSVNPETKFVQGIWLGVFILFIVFAFKRSEKIQVERYQSYAWDRVETTRQNFQGAEAFLDKIGIPKDAKMLVIDAYSYNVPLILMNRKGYTVHQTVRDDAAFSLFWAKWDYVVIQDVFLASDVLHYYPIVSYMIEPLAGNGKITVYKRADEFRKRSVATLLRKNKKTMIYTTRIDFDDRLPNDHFGDTWNVKYAAEFGTKGAFLDASAEYGVTFKIGAKELKEKVPMTVSVTTDFIWKENSDIQMVATISDGTASSYYQSYKLRDYYKPSVQLQDGNFYFVLPEFQSEKDVLSIYFWNPSKGDLLYDNLEITVYKSQ
ncbi:hypothetical protein BH10BAC1_BH10BAC1_02190 [soil metagenome]